MTRDFHDDTKRLVADLSANVCNNPKCQKLCAGPSNGHNVEKKYIGEVAHIVDKATVESAHTTIRFRTNFDDAKCRDADNAIFLCPNCHTEIDKNRGSGYPATTLLRWRKAHYELVHECLINGYSLTRQLKASSASAATFNQLMNHCHNMGALIDDPNIESWRGVVESFGKLREEAAKLLGLSGLAPEESKALKGLQTVAMAVRAHISLDDQGQLDRVSDERAKATLLLAREQVGTELKELSRLTGCTIPDSIKHIVPDLPFRGLK